MTLMRFDPFRDLDRLAPQAMSVGVVLGSADRPYVLAGCAPAQEAAAAATEPAPAGSRSAS